MSASRVHKLRLHLSRRGWLVLAVVGVMLSSFTADAVASIGRVRSGVRVGALSLGGSTGEEAEALLTDRARQLASEPVSFVAKGESLTVEPEDVGFFPDVDATLRRAMDVGRVGNPVVRFWHRLRTYFADTDIGWSSEVDAEKVESLVDGWAEEYDNPSQEAAIEGAPGGITAVGPVEGNELDRARARRAVLRALEGWPRNAVTLPFATTSARTDLADAQAAAEAAERMVSAPITVTGPDGGRVELSPADLTPLLEAVPVRRGSEWALDVRFSAERITEQLGERMEPFEREAKSATFQAAGGSVSIVPHTDGLSFDAEATAQALTEAAGKPAPREVAAAMKTTPPKMTTEQAEALNIHERVSTFTTNHACCQPRVQNIHRMADMVDNALIRPGETFSLNAYVGKRTTAKGYVDAPMIYDGEYKDSVGGGVSQFATTFFNAIFFGGYQVVSHKPHSYYISRYPAGREATISWPAPDLKFRNDSGAGILVRTAYSSTSITVSFYGDSRGWKVASDSGERTNFTDPPVERKANPALRPGSERVVQRGSQGFDIVVWRIITKDGDQVRKDRFFTRYKPEPRIVEFGPGTPAPSPAPSDPPDDPTPPPASTPPPSTPKPET